MGALHALHARGLRDRVAIIGFDDLPLGDLLSPALTVMAQDVRGLGTRAGELLFGRIDGTDTGPWEEVVLPMQLLARGSGEIRPGGTG
jgi:LacI family transcriptional regulator